MVYFGSRMNETPCGCGFENFEKKNVLLVEKGRMKLEKENLFT